MIRPGWAVRTKLNKVIRLRLPGPVLVEIYNLKRETGLTVSDVVRLMLQDVLCDEERIKKIFEPYRQYYQKLQRHTQAQAQKQQQKQLQQQQDDEDDWIHALENDDDIRV